MSSRKKRFFIILLVVSGLNLGLLGGIDSLSRSDQLIFHLNVVVKLSDGLDEHLNSLDCGSTTEINEKLTSKYSLRSDEAWEKIYKLLPGVDFRDFISQLEWYKYVDRYSDNFVEDEKGLHNLFVLLKHEPSKVLIIKSFLKKLYNIYNASSITCNHRVSFFLEPEVLDDGLVEEEKFQFESSIHPQRAFVYLSNFNTDVGDTDSGFCAFLKRIFCCN